MVTSSQKITFSLAAVLSLSLLTACGNPTSQQDGSMASNIIGGQEASLDFQKKNGVVALLSFVQQKQQVPEAQVPEAANDNEPQVSVAICTGSLLSKRVILTAAHCVDDENLTGVAAFFTNDITTESAMDSAIPVRHIEIHPEYGEGNDMALVFLAQDAPADFQFAKLPETDITSTLKGEHLTLAGYGITNPFVNGIVDIDPETGKAIVLPLPSEGDGVLRSVDGIETLDISKDGKEITLSGYTGKKGACHGDSGGPAYLAQENGDFLLVGVTSRGTNPLGNCNREAIYGSVPAQMDWLRPFLQ